jgi:hypothetical protein
MMIWTMARKDGGRIEHVRFIVSPCTMEHSGGERGREREERERERESGE